jgi:hypothetical protein
MRGVDFTPGNCCRAGQDAVATRLDEPVRLVHVIDELVAELIAALF